MDDSDTTHSQYDSERQEVDVKDFETVIIHEEIVQEEPRSRTEYEETHQVVKVPVHERGNISEVESSAAESTSKPDEIISSPLVAASIEPPSEINNQRSGPAHDYETTPEWHFFHSLMPDIMTMTAAQKRKLRIKFLCAVDEILDKE